MLEILENWQYIDPFANACVLTRYVRLGDPCK